MVNLDTLEMRDVAKLLVVVDRRVTSLVADQKKRDLCIRQMRHLGTNFTPTPSVSALMTVPLIREEDVMRAKAVSRSVATALGFSEERMDHVVAGVVDLAGNVLKASKRGALVFRKLGSPPGLEVTAFDSDSSRGVNRLATVQVKADHVAVESQAHLGSTIRATWFVAPGK